VSSSAFAKRERERIKREKAQRKKERIETRRSEAGELEGEDAAPVRDQAAVLAELQALHAALDDEKISFEDFEAAKAELMTQLQV
jgi:hypothetical protein